MIILEDETAKSAPELPHPPPVHPVRQYGSTSAPLPPSYIASPSASARSTSTSYLFLPQTFPPNSMVLAPTDNLPQPEYFITVNLNCFTPSSYITRITHGSFEGELVGQFEMSAVEVKKPGKCMLFENEHWLSDVLDHKRRARRDSWKWKAFRPGHASTVLYWDTRSHAETLSCFSSKERINNNLLAKLSVPVHLRKPDRAPERVKLEFFSNGQEFFEDILVSSLIIERIRTMPSP